MNELNKVEDPLNHGEIPLSRHTHLKNDRTGVSNHRLTPGRMTRILDQFEKTAPSNDYEKEGSRNTLNPNLSLVHPSTYHAHFIERQNQKQQITGIRPGTSQVSQNNVNKTSSTTTNSNGIVASTRKWIDNLRKERQRESLAKAVEEQRQILKEEAKKIRDRSRRERFGDHYVNEEESIRDRLERKQAEKGLGGNSTFISITQSVESTSRALGLCGVEDSDNDYLSDSSDIIYHQSNDDDLSSCDSSTEEHFETVIQNNEAKDIYVTDTKGGEDVLKIGFPHNTLSGQGVSVKVEIFDDADSSQTKSNNDDSISDIKIIEEPKCNIPFLLSKEHMRSIAQNGLPASVLFAKWKRVYSLARDGDSFTGSFMRLIKNEARSLLVIKATTGEIFGAYSDSPFKSQGNVSASFYGSAQAFLYSITKDNSVRVFKWTGSNRYIQLCDTKSKMLAFGGGGKQGEFGLCVEDDFRIGSTGPCDTFGNKPLCTANHFDILDVECWSFISGVF